jgi:hypothetical protein
MTSAMDNEVVISTAFEGIDGSRTAVLSWV